MRRGLLRVWVAAAGAAAGAFHGCEGIVGPRGAAVAGGVALACLVVRNRRTALLGLCALAFAACALGAHVQCRSVAAVGGLARSVPHCRMRGEVLQSAGGLGLLVSADELRCEGFAPVVDAGTVVIGGEEANAGATVIAAGWLFPLADDGFGTARARLGARAEFGARSISFGPPRSQLHRLAQRAHQGIARATSDLDRREAALIKGMTVGDTSGFETSTEEEFRRSGLSHLVAVSGSNVAIVLAVVGLATVRLSLRTRLIADAIALGLYVLVVGPEPSVLRAALMGAITLFGLLWGERAEPLHALALAITLLLVLRPAMLYSVGLHLSAGATAGIILWSGCLARRLTPLPSPVRLALAATLAAQIAVAPILAGVFGQLSIAAPLANLLAFPAVAPVTVLGLASGAIGTFWPALGASIAALAAPFARWILLVADTFGTPAWASWDVPTYLVWPLGGAVVIAAGLSLRPPMPSRVGSADGGVAMDRA